MPKAPPTEDALRAIQAIRLAPEQYDLKRDLAPFFKHKSNHVIAAAAKTARTLEAAGLAPELTGAFLEIMRDPARRDPRCDATIAIVEALAAMDEPAAQVYFTGIRHVQKEGSFGPPLDSAAPLRGLCAQGLARMGHPDALQECVTLLCDPHVPARTGAVRAIGDSGRPEGLLLLRLKALVGDEEDEIVGECFSALLRLGGAQSLEFVAEFLRKSEDVAQRAAFALGESHLAAALPLLRVAWEQSAQASLRRTLLLAIALLRLDEGVEFLIARIGEDSERSASDALAALSMYSRDEQVRARVEQAVEKRKSRALSEVFAREFGLS